MTHGRKSEPEKSKTRNDKKFYAATTVTAAAKKLIQMHWMCKRTFNFINFKIEKNRKNKKKQQTDQKFKFTKKRFIR